MSKENGGPAFPQEHLRLTNGVIEGGEKGMTLRDYFAAKAMQGFLSGETFNFEMYRDDPLRVARWSYEAADGMLQAREEQ
jgi:hypothetical protein